MNESFPSAVRLRKQADFDRVFAANLVAADEVLVVLATHSASGSTRLGLVVSRHAGSAVVRNRWKRLIREAFRRKRNQLAKGMDLVVRPRRGAKPELRCIEQSLLKLTDQLRRRLDHSAGPGPPLPRGGNQQGQQT